MYNRNSDTSKVSSASKDTSELAIKYKAKFLKEARRLASLRHESIVAVSNAFEENGTAYFVMDFIEGNDLNQLVKAIGPIPVDRALRYINQIGRALIYLHSLRINHLDVKPANILLDTANDRVMLIDFGLSKQYNEEGQQTSTTPVGISHGYAPLEQYKSGGVQDFSAPTDVYSLGATLYYLLTGSRPPEATALGDEVLAFPAHFPANIQEAITKAMCPYRPGRYQTVGEFLEGLKNNNKDDSTTIFTVRPSETSPTEKPVKKNPKEKPGETAPKDRPVKKIITNQQKPKPSKPEKSDRLSVGCLVTLGLAVIVGIILLAVALNGTGNKENQEEDSAVVEETVAVPVSPFRTEPRNLDLCVEYYDQIGYISEDEWMNIDDYYKSSVSKKGIYLIGKVDGYWREFILNLFDLQEEEITWGDAMSKYGNSLPNEDEIQVMENNCSSINLAMEIYGGKSMNNIGSSIYWSCSSCYGSNSPRFVDMEFGSHGYVSQDTGLNTYRVRAVTPVPE